MGFIGVTNTDNQAVTSESIGTASYPLTVSGATAANVFTATGAVPTSTRGTIATSIVHTVTMVNRKITIHAGMPYVYNSRSGLNAPNVEQFGFALFVNGTCLRVVAVPLPPTVNGASFVQLAAAVNAPPGAYTIDLRVMVPTAQSSVIIGGGYGASSNPFIIIRESS